MLGEQRLRPGPGARRDVVERSQRERLYAAMVAVATEIGYGRTRVSDLTAMAGVSRTTFYRYFAHKEECFLATLDELIEAALSFTAQQVSRQGGWEERARRGVDAFTSLIVRQPAAARLCLVESYAAGPAATDRVDAAMSGFEQLMAYVFSQNPEGGDEMPPLLVSALIGGVRKIAHSRLHRRAEPELIELLPEVLELDMSYRPPPEPLRDVVPHREPAILRNRRAEAAERIERATLACVAEHGIDDAAISEIASRAEVSLTTFYSQFDGKEEALEGALLSGRMYLQAASEPAFRRGHTWPEAICAGLEAFFGFYESEPDFARVATTHVYGAGATELERMDRSIEAWREFLEGGYELSPGVSPVAREAIPCAVYSLLCQRVSSKGTARLRELTPVATYLVLAPFLGAEQAGAVANGATP